MSQARVGRTGVVQVKNFQVRQCPDIFEQVFTDGPISENNSPGSVKHLQRPERFQNPVGVKLFHLDQSGDGADFRDDSALSLVWNPGKHASNDSQSQCGWDRGSKEILTPEKSHWSRLVDEMKAERDDLKTVLPDGSDVNCSERVLLLH